MNVTLAQTAPKLNRSNLDAVLSIVAEYQADSDLIVFPELALNGYMLQDKLYEDAWDISELDALATLSENVDICVGAALRDKNVFKNTALYFSKGALLSQHDKLHLPNYGMFEEARYFKAGNIFESFETTFGKVSMLVCEDMWHDSMHKNLVKENPSLILALAASPARGFKASGLEIEDSWQKILKSIAKDCDAKLVFVNRVGFEDGLGFWGGSCIVDAEANIMYRLPHYEEIIKTFKI
ncbi:MAG: nitrilase-related carbon-nitrogen hydrolase [Sulfurimonas sp.]|nr:nitrilase-related carbon-nitrogen hydrolase [Sulfurimonas sp.]MDQ7061578.1 nitrilase-related carbon-nitrogen hydrolase [Sulfurimonas sp.]